MADTIKSIINSSRNRETAIANFNANVTGGNKLDSDAFYRELDSKFRINASSGGESTTSSGGGTTSTLRKTGNIAEKLIASQEQTGQMPGIEDEMIKASKAASGLFGVITNLKDPMKILSAGVNIFADQAELYLQQQTELLGVINKEAGLTGQFSEDVRDELTQANIPLQRLGIGFKELAEGAKNLVSDSGRFITLNKQSWYDAGVAATAYVGTLGELVQMYPAFEKIGVGASDVATQIKETGERSLNLGLQASKTTKELGSNIGKINEYGFKNGIQGLSEMVRKSTEFRMSMETAFKVADDVMDPDKAIDMAANLQAIGGAIGEFNDPLKLMYMATNNVEGLQDALIGVAGSLATYNQEQGRFEITGVNLRKAKAMATELGISYTELANGAIAAAERSTAASALLGRGLKLDDDQQRFLTNISQMKGGQMSIELNSDRLKDALGVDRKSGEISLDKLTQKQVDTLLKYQDEFKKMTPEEIIQKQATTVENIARDVNYMAAAARVSAVKAGGDFADKIKEALGIEGSIPDKIRKKSKELADSVGSSLGQEPIKATPVSTPQQSVPVNNSTSTTNTQTTTAESQTNQPKEITLNVKTSEPIMDEFSRYIMKRPETIDAFLNSTDPRDYTNQK